MSDSPAPTVITYECSVCKHWFISFIVFACLVGGAYHYGSIKVKNEFDLYVVEQQQKIEEAKRLATEEIVKQQEEHQKILTKLQQRKREHVTKIVEIRESGNNPECLSTDQLVLWNSANKPPE